MKHVYLIGNRSCAAQYGIGTYIHQVIECIKDISDIRLTVVVLNAETDDVVEKRESSTTVRYLNFSIQDVLWEEKKELRYYRNIAYSLAQYFLPEEKNIIHLNYLHHAPLVNWLKKMEINFCLTLTIHYFEWCFSLQSNTSRLHSVLTKSDSVKSKLELLISSNYKRDKVLFNQADMIICLSQFTQNIIQTSYGITKTKTALIYNGLKDEAVSLNKEEREKKKHSLGFQVTDKIILFVGRLDNIKGLKFLIKAFHQVLLTIPESKLVIIGDGFFDEYLKECTDIWTKVFFTGKIQKDQLYTFYQIADAGALPSFHEQCSYVGIEMLMHGLPWIGTNSSGLKEMVDGLYCLPLKEEGENLTVSTELLSQWLIEILKQPRAKEFRNRFEKYYTLFAMKEKLYSIYSNF